MTRRNVHQELQDLLVRSEHDRPFWNPYHVPVRLKTAIPLPPPLAVTHRAFICLNQVLLSSNRTISYWFILMGNLCLLPVVRSGMKDAWCWKQHRLSGILPMERRRVN